MLEAPTGKGPWGIVAGKESGQVSGVCVKDPHQRATGPEMPQSLQNTENARAIPKTGLLFKDRGTFVYILSEKLI